MLSLSVQLQSTVFSVVRRRPHLKPSRRTIQHQCQKRQKSGKKTQRIAAF